MAEKKLKYFFGTFMHTPTANSLSILRDTLVSVTPDGLIRAIEQPGDEGYKQSIDCARNQSGFQQANGSKFYIPGLVDLHIHAPQWPQLGKSLHLPLQDWLLNCTFPLEARYADTDFASAMYTSLVDTLLANGTTSAVYFATVHSRATGILAELCVEKGQRAWVGRVAMDHTEQCPEYYRDETTEQGLIDSEQSIHHIRALPGNEQQLVRPIITPRFIPSCTDEMLEGLGALASQHQCHIQTHCSESDWEHQFVHDRYGFSDTEALQQFGLLTRKSVLAHSNFISDKDMAIIKHQRSGIAHCPLSNQYFADSIFPLRKALDKGLHVGLGTDISGGPSASQFESCRHVISSSRMLESGTNPATEPRHRGVAGSRSDFIEAFYLATAGGGVVLEQPIGQFAPGYRFDALMIDPAADHSNLMYFPELDTEEDLFQKMIYSATRSNVAGVWVDGIQRAPG